jgi:hypothetical protein
MKSSISGGGPERRFRKQENWAWQNTPSFFVGGTGASGR